MGKVLYAKNIGGDISYAVENINEIGLADHLISLHPVSAYTTVCVFRLTAEQIAELKANWKLLED